MPIRRAVAIETAVTLALWLALLGFGRSQLLRDPGTFWHTVLGEQILDQGGPVRVDPFSFTRPAAPYVDYEWLAELAMGALYRLGGWDALLLVTSLVLAWTFGRVFGRLLQAGLHALPAGLLLGLALAASSHQFHVRPLVISMALLVWSYGLLVDVEAGRVPPRRLGWLVVVFVLWVNCHGGVLAGIGTVGLVCGGWAAAALWPSLARRLQLQPMRVQAVWLAPLLALACLATVLVNPFGLAMPRIWMEILALPLPQLIQEHFPLDFSEPYAWYTLALAAVYLIVLLGTLGRRLRATWLLPLVWFGLALMRVRNAPLMALTAIVGLADMLPYCRWSGWLAARGFFQAEAVENAPSSGAGRRSWGETLLRCSPAMLLVLFLGIQAAGVRVPLVGSGWARWDSAYWPLELVPQLQEAQQDVSAGGRIFNDLRLGGFVIYHAPRLKVFIDDRCDFYGRTMLLEYEKARTERPEMLADWQRQYGFRWALVVPDTPLDAWLAKRSAAQRNPASASKDRWQCVGRSPSGALYRLGP